MNATPRMDAKAFHVGHITEKVVALSAAQQIEKELAAAQAERDEWRLKAATAIGAASKLLDERDRLAAKLAVAREAFYKIFDKSNEDSMTAHIASDAITALDAGEPSKERT